MVNLRKITHCNLEECLNLKVTKEQDNFGFKETGEVDGYKELGDYEIVVKLEM